MSNRPATPVIPVSWGELIDKLTILEIKQSKIHQKLARKNIDTEFLLLNSILIKSLVDLQLINPLRSALKDINLQLWDVEDRIREKDSLLEFDQDFILLARAVYRLNDARSQHKKQINQALNSELHEEKTNSDFHLSGKESSKATPERQTTNKAAKKRQ